MAKKKKKMEFETMQVKLPHVKGLSIVLPVIYILWVAVMYYLLLPALNIHSRGLWLFVLGVILFPLGIIGALVSAARKAEGKSAGKLEKPVNGIFAAVGVIGILFLILLFYGSKMFHAQAYADILTIEDSDFNSDINTASSVSKIALMDTDSAVLLGNREIGSLSEVVSQYNVSEDYTQIDYQGAPTKVSALEYAGFFKYMGNKENGVPGYITVDPVGQKAQYVPVKEGMIYVPSAYFGKDILPVYTNTPSVYLVEKPSRVQSAVTQSAETVSIMMHQKCRTGWMMSLTGIFWWNSITGMENYLMDL